MEFLKLLLGTLLLRPYIFAFLAIFLFLASAADQLEAHPDMDGLR